MICPNCKNKMGCSCQKRVTAKGTVGCSNCISSLMQEEKLSEKKIK